MKRLKRQAAMEKIEKQFKNSNYYLQMNETNV